MHSSCEVRSSAVRFSYVPYIVCLCVCTTHDTISVHGAPLSCIPTGEQVELHRRQTSTVPQSILYTYIHIGYKYIDFPKQITGIRVSSNIYSFLNVDCYKIGIFIYVVSTKINLFYFIPYLFSFQVGHTATIS